MPRATLIPLILIIATALALGGVVGNDFSLWDDPGTVWNNPDLNPPTWSGVLRYWREPAHGLYIPVTYSVWAAIAAMATLERPDNYGIMLHSWPFHLANLLAHVAAVLVVYAILRQLVAKQWPACLGALLYGLHPVQVEAVAWVSGLKDVLAGMLGLVALWQYLRFAKTAAAPARWIHYSLATLALMLALLAKPSAMVVPLMALAIDALVLRRGLREMAMTLAPWFALAAAAALVAKLVQPAIIVPDTPLWARPLIAGDALAFYLYKLTFPLKLAIDYGRRPPVVMQHWWLYVTWLVPALLAIVLILRRRRAPLLLLAGCLFVAGVLPMLGWTRFLFQMYSTTADHYLYLAMLGPALALAWLLAWQDERRTYVVAILVLAALGIRTILQARYWSDDYALFSRAAEITPNSFPAQTNLGNLYYRDGNLEAAERHFRAAVAARDDLVDARNNLANVLALQGRVDEAIEQIRAELRIRERQPPEVAGDYAETYLHVAQLLMQRGRYTEAADELQRLLRLHPQHEKGRELLEAAGGRMQ